MFSKLHLIEKLNYSDVKAAHSCSDWAPILTDYFSPRHVDDVSDFDRTSCCSFLVSLNKNNEGLFSDSIDLLLEKENAYFFQVLISGEKPLTAMLFWNYPKGEKGQVLLTSPTPYLIGHNRIIEEYLVFVRETDLLVLTDADLRAVVPWEGRQVSVYYRYFNQVGENPLDILY